MLLRRYFDFLKKDVHCCVVGKDAPTPPLEFVVTTKLLVVAAGTLGTAEILLRSRTNGSVPMSPAVGLSFGADGDFFRPSFNGESKTNTLGYGKLKMKKKKKFSKKLKRVKKE